MATASDYPSSNCHERSQEPELDGMSVPLKLSRLAGVHVLLYIRVKWCIYRFYESKSGRKLGVDCIFNLNQNYLSVFRYLK